MKTKVVILWFRRDLRLHNQAALQRALQSHYPIIPLYIHDVSGENCRILGGAQQWWLHHSLYSLTNDLRQKGSNLILRQGRALETLQDFHDKYDLQGVFWGRCYDPQAIARDIEIKKFFKTNNINVESFNTSLLFEPWTIKNDRDEPFKVFSQFWKTCLKNGKLYTIMIQMR